MNPSNKRYEAARAAIEASEETFPQIAESRAEMSALEELITVQEELGKKRAQVRARQEALIAKKMSEEIKRLETMLALLESKSGLPHFVFVRLGGRKHHGSEKSAGFRLWEPETACSPSGHGFWK